jgi:hypothetical protein
MNGTASPWNQAFGRGFCRCSGQLVGCFSFASSLDYFIFFLSISSSVQGMPSLDFFLLEIP